MLNSITDIFELLEDSGLSCEWWDPFTIGIHDRTHTYSLEDLANKVEKILDTLDNIFTREYDSFEDKNDTVIFLDNASLIKIAVY